MPGRAREKGLTKAEEEEMLGFDSDLDLA